MNNNPQMFHGEWWVPAVADYNTCMIALNPEQMMGHETKYPGTLTYYEDSNSTLELYRIPSKFHSHYYHQNKVMWGRDANGNIFTLFNVLMKEQHLGDFTNTKFIVDMILIGEHVLSLDYNKYSRCVIKYSYLVNWTFYETRDVINTCYNHQDKFFNLTVPYQTINIFEASIDKTSKWILNQNNSIGNDIQGFQIMPTPYFEICATEPTSLKSYIMQIKEFTQFLSIALFGIQDPVSVEFIIEGDYKVRKLLFKKEVSYNPGFWSVIKLKEMKKKLPSMLILWHSNFEKIAPISRYLIESLHKKNRFDVPDFLIIAQALDGYHKRFVNKKNGKDIRKYEDQIEILLNQFKDVEVIKQCKINPLVLKDTRHKYSHLYPDDEESLAVTDGGNLFWLTEKCKILLTCCILNMLGLTNEEINLCCEQSPISQIIDSLPPEID